MTLLCMIVCKGESRASSEDSDSGSAVAEGTEEQTGHQWASVWAPFRDISS